MRYTSAEFLALWKSLPGNFNDKKTLVGGPFVFAREMSAASDPRTDDEAAADETAFWADRKQAFVLEAAFDAYFASTPEGKEEGRWDNVVAWQWIAAGRPAKIPARGHSLRMQFFARFKAEWLAHMQDGTAMTMVAPSVASKRPRRRSL